MLCGKKITHMVLTGIRPLHYSLGEYRWAWFSLKKTCLLYALVSLWLFAFPKHGCMDLVTMVTWTCMHGHVSSSWGPRSSSVIAWENMPTWLTRPRFHAPLHNFHPPGMAPSRIAGPNDSINYKCIWIHATLLIMVIEIRFNFQICVQWAEKAKIDSLSISNEILSTFGIGGTPEY